MVAALVLTALRAVTVATRKSRGQSKGIMRLAFDGQIKPKDPSPQPMRRPSPSRSRHASGTIEGKKRSQPELLRISLAINRNGHIDYRAYRSATSTKIQPSDQRRGAQSLQTSMVGTGYFSANVILPDSRRSHLKARSMPSMGTCSGIR